MSEEARGASRSQPAVEPGWEALLDPAMLEARLAEARARREEAIARRKAAGDAPGAASQARAERLRSLDLALAGGTDATPARPQSRPPLRATRSAAVAELRTEPRAESEPAKAPLATLPARAPATRSAGPRPLPIPQPREDVPAPGLAGPTMPERLAAVLVPPAAGRAATETATAAMPARPGRPIWPWAAPALGLVLGGGVALAVIWWQPSPSPSSPPPTQVATPVTTAPVTTAPVTTAPVATAPVTTAPVMPAPVTTMPSAAPLVVAAAPSVPAEPAQPPKLPGVDAPAITSGALRLPEVPSLAPAPRRLPSIEPAMAAVASLVAGPGSVRAALHFSGGQESLPPDVARAELMLPGGAPVAPAVDYALSEEPEAAAPVAVSQRRTRAAAPDVVAAEPQAAPAAAPEPAAAPAPAAPGIRNRLERAVESMLRNRILGQ